MGQHWPQSHPAQALWLGMLGPSHHEHWLGSGSDKPQDEDGLDRERDGDAGFHRFCPGSAIASHEDKADHTERTQCFHKRLQAGSRGHRADGCTASIPPETGH